jgi:hypothetical protein
MASDTQTRLDAYLAAELAILKAQESRSGDASRRMADLAQVREQIDRLQRQLARETAPRSGLNYAVADLSGEESE